MKMDVKSESMRMVERLGLLNSAPPDTDSRSLQSRFSSLRTHEDSEDRIMDIETNFQALKVDFINHRHEQRKLNYKRYRPYVTDEEFRELDKALIQGIIERGGVDPIIEDWKLFLEIHSYQSPQELGLGKRSRGLHETVLESFEGCRVKAQRRGVGYRENIPDYNWASTRHASSSL